MLASIKQLTRLFTALSSDDLAAAREAASEISDSEEELGHHVAARTLRGALRPNKPKVYGSIESTDLSVGTSLAISNALKEVQPATPLSQVTLPSSTRRELIDLVTEWKMRERLRDAGVPRRTRLLFHGPPGCGKSLTAAALGLELGVPVYVVRFDAVIGAFLGQTALRIRELFHFAETTPCVLLLDEVDALAKQRGNPQDVGELDRIVISFMQEMEHSWPRGLIICTSNLPDRLDAALWRRFDLILKFPRPSRRALRRFAEGLASSRNLGSEALNSRKMAECRAFSDVERVVNDLSRKALLRSELKA